MYRLPQEKEDIIVMVGIFCLAAKQAPRPHLHDLHVQIVAPVFALTHLPETWDK
jgi:hypothetical protein